MEILILICLLVVIFLLLQDKVVIKKVMPKEDDKEKHIINLPEIMGLAKPIMRLSTPNISSEGQSKNQTEETNNFDHDIENKDFDKQIPQEELDEVFGEIPDLREEEEEWNRYGVADDDDGFATGVTFEELATVGRAIRREMPEPSLEKQAVAIVHKIQGTELFSLLENSMEGASRKIAELLDKSLSSKIESGSSILRKKNDLNDFDIGAFV